MTRSLGRLASTALGLFATLGLTGCGGLDPVATYTSNTDPTTLFMALTLDHRAVNLSTASGYNTVQLTATPRNALGEAMDGLPAPIYSSSDTVAVRVTADGEVEARQPTAGAFVIAQVTTEGNVRHADTAVVKVTDDAPPPTLGSFSITPVPPDTGVWFVQSDGASFGFYSLIGFVFAGLVPLRLRVTVTALTTTGDPMPGLEIAYSSLDPDIAKPFAPFQLGRRGGFMTTLRPGKVHVVAQTMAYGVTMADTFTVTVTLPLGFDIALGRDGVPISSTNVQIQRGGAIAWLNYTLQPIDVMFDDPTNVVAPPPEVCAVITDAFGYTPAPYCGSGDITSFAGADGDIFLPDGSISMRMRQFPVPGVYRYHTSTGLAGQVVVE